MITGLDIKNFRGLRDVSLDGLARVNVIVGDNGSGKTALLEAVDFLVSSSALVASHANGFRGIRGEPQQFFDFATDGADHVEIRSRGSGPFSRELVIRPDPTRPTILRSGHVQPELFANVVADEADAELPSNRTPVPVVFAWKDAEGRALESVAQPGAGSYPPWLALGDGRLPAIGAVFLAAGETGQRGIAGVFSTMEKRGTAAAFLEAMREQFPSLDAISIQLEGKRPMLHARLKDDAVLRPLEHVSGGVTRLASILLALASYGTKVVLIDEIENGLHHSRLQLLWRQVRDFAERFDTQVFATTHSLECLDAAAAAITDSPDDFAFIRMTRYHGDCVARLLPGNDAGPLLRSSLEVRG